ncbi:MAG TPA: hypothetical protein VG245_02915 [Candidatus Dormibacteraeota bacterium]|nr:hypothetical protein [Candidatus Dormibacteraeota bacterium]
MRRAPAWAAATGGAGRAAWRALTRPRPARRGRLATAGLGLALATAVLALAPNSIGEATGGPPRVGFSFSPELVHGGRDPLAVLSDLLDALHPDVVRLPVFWEAVAPTADSLDFGGVDALVDVVRQHDASTGDTTRVVLVVGVRNIGYPEVHVPGWVSAYLAPRVPELVKLASYRQYLSASFSRYRSEPLLEAWQLENEPLDNIQVLSSGPISLSQSQLNGELRLARSIDRVHPVMLTTYNSSTLALDQQGSGPLTWLRSLLPGPRPAGHPAAVLGAGQVMGLDVYVSTPATPLADAGIAQRVAWKVESLKYWSRQAAALGKPLWIAEMQAAPWNGQGEFGPADLVSSADAYRTSGVAVVLFWQVEDWTVSPEWMAAGKQAVEELRAG